MNTTFRYPSPEEVQACMRLGERERSAFVVASIGRLFRALTGRRPPSAEIVSIPASQPRAVPDHRLAA